MISSFTCQTCQVSSSEIGKHISATRHKNIVFDELNETVQCEECGDANIHILQMLRYGLSDLSLLCAECNENSNSAATAEYTLANGSIFNKLPQYYKFRDINCISCGTDRKLAVANAGNKQIIKCFECIEKEDSSMKFISEASDNFLFALLGIKEYVPKSTFQKKNGPRKLGRKGGRDTRPKAFDPEAEKRRAHYENEKATRLSLKSAKTLKAVGSNSASPVISRSTTPSRPQVNKAGRTGNTQQNVRGEKGKKDSGDKSKVKRKDSTEPKESKKGGKPSTSIGQANGERVFDSHASGTVTTQGKSTKKNSSKTTEKTLSISEKSKERVSCDLKKDSKDSKRKNTKTEINAKTEKIATDERKGRPARDTDAKGKSVEKPQMVPSDKPATKNFKPSKPKKSVTKAKTSVEDKKSNTIKLPPGIFKHTPSATPKLTYDSMDEYYNEMCYNLFLEEKMSTHTSSKVILSPEDFELEWYADQNKKHKQFKLSMLLTPEFLDRYLSKKMQNLKKNPFVAGQSLILMLGDDIPWYGKIVFVDTMSSNPKRGKPKRGKWQSDNSPKLMEIIVELHKWNKMPLPISTDVRNLKILPVSVPVSRVFTAMSRISNPKFIDLIMGKTPIRQIFFKNYLKFTRDTFNDSQKVAVQSVMNNSITVLQGPPGTGKTSTIYEIVLQLLENLNTYPILVVAASNIAIDNIAEKLLPKHGNSILRIVSMEKEPEYNRDHPLASICLHHRVFDGMPANLQDSIREMRRPNSNLSQSQYKKLLTAQISYSDKIIASSRVIFTTTVVAGGNQLKSIPKMPIVIMDEATQSSEPTTLIPLSLNGVEKFVFVGDQNQLSSFSQVPNLSLSLFERILLNGSYKTPHMLDTQYRMHPAISKFPRETFYGGLLKDGLTAADRQIDGIPSNPVVFWDTRGKCLEGTVFSKFREDSGLTYANVGEADFVQKVLLHLIFEKNVKKSQIGVITPYRGQRDLISSTLVKNDLINPEKDEVHIEVDREDFYNESKPVTIHTVSDIMIASIDAFQGREKDFLIMSCVRSNKSDKIGFLSDARRMNVALTRAKYGLILVGDMECLKNADALWNEYITSLEKVGSIKKSPDFKFE